MAEPAERNEPYTPEERTQIVLLVDVLLSVGASWEQVKLELYRVACQDGAPFKRVPSQSTLERMLCEELELANLTEYKEKRKDGIKVALKNKAVQMALAGNTAMLIFSLKNLCGWSDNVQQVPDPEDAKNKIRMAYDPKAV